MVLSIQTAFGDLVPVLPAVLGAAVLLTVVAPGVPWACHR
jgi:hypothetical protein